MVGFGVINKNENKNFKKFNSMKKFIIVLLTSFLCSISFNAFAQVSLSGGIGTEYGGMGGKISYVFDTGNDVGIGLTGSFGYNIVPFGFGRLYHEYYAPNSSFRAKGERFSKRTIHGYGASAGILLDLDGAMYMSLQGTFLQEGRLQTNGEKMPIFGINWTPLAGKIYLGNSSVFLDLGANISLLFWSSKYAPYPSHLGLYLGANVGIGYTFY